MKEIPGSPVHNSAGTPRSFAMSTPPASSAGVNAPGGTASPRASVEPSPSVSEQSETPNSPSPALGGKAARELRGLDKLQSPGRDALPEGKENLIWIRQRCLLKKCFLLRSSGNGCRYPESMTSVQPAAACCRKRH